MIPLKLSIKGLYSYQETQTIDFSTLTEAMLFGIFGDVGSGKSSILEAISLVLFDDTDRMKSTGRNYNILNLKSNELNIEFEFINFEGNTYKYCLTIKRGKKNFEEIKTPERICYKQTDGVWESYEYKEHKIEDVIGLSYSNFKRTIIIPQGKFQEFLQLTGKNRTDMLMEIFNLNKYDLSNSTSEIDKKNDEKLSFVQGGLIQLNEYNEELKHQLESSIKESYKKLKITSEDLNNAKTKYSELEKIKEQSIKLAELKKEEERLELIRPEIAKLEQKLKKYNRYIHTFKSNFDKLKDKLKENDEEKQRLAKNEDELNNANKELDRLENEFKKASSEHNKIDEYRNTVEDLKTLQEMLKLEDQIKRSKLRVDKGKLEINKEVNAKEKLEPEISKLKNVGSRLDKAQSSLLTYSKINQYVTEQSSIIKQLIDTELEYKTFDENIKKFTDEIKAIKIKYELKGSDIEGELSKKVNDCNNILKKLGEKKTKLEVDKRLGEFASALSPENACPLCGSLNHPKVLHIEDVNSEIEQCSKEIDEINKQKENITTSKQKYQYAYSNLKQSKAQLSAKSNNIDNLKQSDNKLSNQLETHLKELNNDSSIDTSKNINSTIEEYIELKQKVDTDTQERLEISNNLLSKLDACLNQENEEIGKLKEERNKLDKLEKEAIEVSNRIEKYKNAIKEFELESNSSEAKHSILKSKLHLPNDESIYSEPNKEIEIERLSKHIEKTIASFNKYQNDLNKHKELHASLTAKNKEITHSINKTSSELSQIKTIIDTDIDSQARFNKDNEIDELINYELIEKLIYSEFDSYDAESKIGSFKDRYTPTKENIKTIELELSGKVFNTEHYTKLQTLITELSNKSDKQKADLAKDEANLNQCISKLKEKSKLTSDLRKLEERKTHINDFIKLFRGSGFVNYVSSVYLQNICKAANKCFAHLSKQQLHLELSDNNEFIIRDFLNEGKTRSVSSLSGGQLFQASLSMALALAESVQSQNKQNKNFFFLDEGFGSLDKDALKLVFDTLKSLKDENRIIGVISHVEELQQEIPVYLKVKNTTLNGSKISSSWE